MKKAGSFIRDTGLYGFCWSSPKRQGYITENKISLYLHGFKDPRDSGKAEILAALYLGNLGLLHPYQAPKLCLCQVLLLAGLFDGLANMIGVELCFDFSFESVSLWGPYFA